MPKRKKRADHDEIEEISPEDTQEMWVVAGSPPREEELDRPEGYVEPERDEETGEDDQSRDEGEPQDEGRPEDAGQAEDAWDDWYEEAEPGPARGRDAEDEFPVPVFGLPEPDSKPAPRRRLSVRPRLPRIRLPRIGDPDPRRLSAVAGTIAVALAVGFGTYQLGKGSGDDLDAARLQGEAAGRQAGAVEGASQGFPDGYKRGREKGFARAYAEAYRIHYKRAFEQAGLEVPKDSDIDVPAP